MKYTQHLNMPNLNVSDRIIANIPKTYFPDISEIVKPFTFDMSKYDFRIGVATQELEQVFTEEPEVVTENLLFKKTSEPVNELESQLFDILNQQRKILNDNSKILKEMNDSKSKNITQKQSDKKHDSPAFYKDKMWYFEQVGATLIGLVVNEIINRTIGVNPHNTILLAMFLRRFLRFLK